VRTAPVLGSNTLQQFRVVHLDSIVAAARGSTQETGKLYCIQHLGPACVL
jgi:hypothetical protein